VCAREWDFVENKKVGGSERGAESEREVI